MLAERGEPHLVGVAAGEGQRPRERGLEVARRVAGEHDGVEPGSGDLVGERAGIECGQRAHEAHAFDLRQIRCIVRHGLVVDAVAGDVAGPAHVDTDPHLSLRDRASRDSRRANLRPSESCEFLHMQY